MHSFVAAFAAFASVGRCTAARATSGRSANVVRARGCRTSWRSFGRPDFLFVEFRVNGAAEFDVPATEDIVRQARKANPGMDICFVYTVASWMLECQKARRKPPGKSRGRPDQPAASGEAGIARYLRPPLGTIGGGFVDNLS